MIDLVVDSVEVFSLICVNTNLGSLFNETRDVNDGTTVQGSTVIGNNLGETMNAC